MEQIVVGSGIKDCEVNKARLKKETAQAKTMEQCQSKPGIRGC